MNSVRNYNSFSYKSMLFTVIMSKGKPLYNYDS